MTEQEYAVRADAMKGKLYGMALLYLGSASLAVDAVDEAVYKGLRACEKLREEQFFGTRPTASRRGRASKSSCAVSGSSATDTSRLCRRSSALQTLMRIRVSQVAVRNSK